ncbi:MAG: CRTAC1 family protein, partial [Candidatus Poribacteria bacterium]|nr:CRTAC1 family protein [Candidatus Poribacteria bacterium]
FLDIFVTNFSYETNTLYQNNGDGTFTDVSYKAHVGEESYLLLGFGTCFLDYDNDGHLDLFVANGHIFEHVEQMTDVITYPQPNQLFRNGGNNAFTETAFEPILRVSRGAIFGDYDNDGDVDIVITNLNGEARLWRNEWGNRRNWLRIKTAGTTSNRDGIGAQVTVTAGDNTQLREVRTGYSYLCSNDPRVFFGMSDQDTVASVKVRWPSGIVQSVENVPVNQEIVITEEEQ